MWRNKLRSGIVLFAISLGILAGLFSMTFMRGIANQRLDSAILTEISHLQIHTHEFVNVNDLDNYIPKSEEILRNLNEIPDIAATSSRLIVNSIINSAEKGAGIKLTGIHPDQERQVSNLSTKLIEGNYLEPMKRNKGILMGKKLAENLEVKTGSKVVVVLLDINGYPRYHQFKVSGIFNTVSSRFEESVAFVNYDDLLKICGLPEQSAHEIAILLNDRELATPIKAKIEAIYPELHSMEWNEIMPELGFITESMDFMMYIFLLIILFALGFGIVNTMLMVVLERVKELGMLMAVGMNKRRVFRMIMLETVMLSVTGGIIGITAGSVLAIYFSEKGLDLSSLYGEGLSALGYDSVIYTHLTTEMIFSVFVLVMITSLAASVYPALKSLQLNPSEAIRTDA